jgi:hypothetical protein
MPVPDAVHFGPAVDDTGLTYGRVRAMQDGNQFRALQLRFNRFFLEQVGELAKLSGVEPVVYAPFPLFVMTCVGIETAGKIFFSRAPRRGEAEEDVQRLGFLEVCKGIDTHFSRPLSAEDKNEYDSLWGADAHQNAPSYASVVYRVGRHTMIHGYRGKGVYITEATRVPRWRMDGGAVVLNPYWFFGRFAEHCGELWAKFHANTNANNPLKLSAKAYLQDLLG